MSAKFALQGLLAAFAAGSEQLMEVGGVVFLSSLGRNKQKQARDEDFRPPHLLDSDKALFRKDLPLGPNAVHLSIHEAHKEAREHFRG